VWSIGRTVLLFQAILLGLLQGLTEFLPVSSSGHLQGVPFLLGWDRGGSLAFDVLVHAGTLVALLWYFRDDLLGLARDAFGRSRPEAARRQARILIGLLGLGTVPAAAAGVLFADVFEAAFASPRLVAVFLYLTALLLWSAERIRARRIAHAAAAPVEQRSGQELADLVAEDLPTDPGTRTPGELAGAANLDDVGRDVPTIGVRDAVAIGTAQALAIFPGVSRSGATIATGMALGLSRTAAARFSFLLSIPIITGAIAVTMPDLGTPQPGTLPFGPLEMAVGTLAAAISGYWAIRTLLSLVARRSLNGFAVYVTIFATILLVATFVG
jgi:undecaprenyl-diphosphatase